MYIHNRFHLQRSIYRYRSLTHSMSIPLFSCTYPCDIRVYQAVKDVGASYDALVDLFEPIESFLSRLDVYTKVPLIAAAMTDIVIKIMEVLNTSHTGSKLPSVAHLPQACCSSFFQSNSPLPLTALRAKSTKETFTPVYCLTGDR